MAAGSEVTRVVDGLHRIKLGFVSAYLLETDDGLVLVDCGEVGRSEPITQAVASLGRAVGQINHILVTHHHPDHTGSLAAMARQAGAPVYVHPGRRRLRPRRANMARTHPSRGRRRRSDCAHPRPHTRSHGVPAARDGGVLIAGDAATNIRRVRRGDHWLATVVTADRAAARSSFHRLADLEFEAAVFGHGSPILSGASAQFRAARR